MLNKTWVGEGTGQKFAPFLGNSEVVGRPYPWGLTDEGGEYGQVHIFLLLTLLVFSFFVLSLLNFYTCFSSVWSREKKYWLCLDLGNSESTYS